MTKKAKILIVSIVGAILSALAGILTGDTVKGVFTKEPVKQEQKNEPGKPGSAPRSSLAEPVQLEFPLEKA